MRPLLRCILTPLAAIACGDLPATGSDVRDEIAPPDAYEAVPVAQLEPLAPLCPRTPARCLLPRVGHGSVSAAGHALVTVAGPSPVQLALVPAGADSALLIGRQGGGPGEYQLPALSAVSASGEIRAFDVMSRRLLRWSLDGRAGETQQLALPPAPLQAGSVGGFVGEEVWMLASDRSDASGDTLPMHVYALAPDRPARKLHTLELRLPAHGLGAMIAVSPAFAPAVTYAIRDDGRIVLARGDRLVLEVFARDGRLERRVGFDLAGRRVTDEDIARRRESLLRGVSSPRIREAVERSLEQVVANHPAVVDVLATGDGLWVRRSADASGESVEWVEFDGSFRPVRRLRLAPTESIIGRHGDRLLVARDGESEEATGYWWMTLR